jgi:hypothetical protein
MPTAECSFRLSYGYGSLECIAQVAHPLTNTRQWLQMETTRYQLQD